MKNIKIGIIIKILILCVLLTTMINIVRNDMNKISAATEDYKEKMIRFHVLANSDTEEDQELKLKVRDKVIEYLHPKLLESENIQQSEQIIKENFEELNDICKNVIAENGYDYDVSIDLTYSNFPTKQYSSVVLPSGEYKALKIVIGSGEGKNWWCVMFPPLCFVDESSAVIDKSTDDKLKEILTEEEYDLVIKKESTELKNTEIKFKIVEIIENLLSNQ